MDVVNALNMNKSSVDASGMLAKAFIWAAWAEINAMVEASSGAKTQKPSLWPEALASSIQKLEPAMALPWEEVARRMS